MTKHSKNNTASSIFSYAEYKKLDYGTRKQRLGNESMKPFDACSLCLQHARDPVACQSGHLFCKECVYTDLLTQKKDIKRQKERIAALRREEQAERQQAMQAARERVLRDFERGQVHLVTSDSRPVLGDSKDVTDGSRGTKRKIGFDKSGMDILMQEAEEDALRTIQREQAEARKSKLPDFWLPSLTPDAKTSVADLADIKLQTLCRAVAPSHPLILKNLTAVSFSLEQKVESDEKSKICPSCRKGLSNNSLLHLIKPCSHVVCTTCYKALVAPISQCVVCEKKLTADDTLKLCREGTGYAAGGRAETSKAGVAFQG